ncbi:MAG: hypothetical protein ACREL1_02545 [bacterium]
MKKQFRDHQWLPALMASALLIFFLYFRYTVVDPGAAFLKHKAVASTQTPGHQPSSQWHQGKAFEVSFEFIKKNLKKPVRIFAFMRPYFVEAKVSPRLTLPQIPASKDLPILRI